MKLRRLLSGAATGAVLLAAAACGNSSAEGIAADLGTDNFAAEVAAATETEQSTHVKAKLTFKGQTMSMTGDVAASTKLEDLAAQLTMEASDEGTFEVRIVDGVLYIKGQGLSSDPAKPWLEFDMTDPSNPLAGFYEQIVANVNPAQSAKMFEAVTELENKGTEQVDGIDATRYEVTVDMDKALELSGVADDLGVDPRQLGNQIPAEITYDVWLETDTALMVRMAMEMQGMQLDLHFSDWGKPVSVEAPPSNQVIEFDL
jgi:LppX_LprAFG lipoprotein